MRKCKIAPLVIAFDRGMLQPQKVADILNIISSFKNCQKEFADITILPNVLKWNLYDYGSSGGTLLKHQRITER